MSYIIALYDGKKAKIDCYWYCDGYNELIQAIRSKFSIKHEIQLKLYDATHDTYIPLTTTAMSAIPKSSTLKVINPNKKAKINTNKQQTKKPIPMEEKQDINKMRKRWKVGSRCEIYSGSLEKWMPGQITNIYTDFDGEWLQVQCVSIETKEMHRYSEYIRPIISESDKQLWSKPKKHKLYVIGNGNCGELSLGYLRETKELIPSQYEKHIQSIQCGNKYSIYCDYHNQIFLASGCNENGECALGNDVQSVAISSFTRINYFSKRKIKIKKVFTNVSGSCTFWLTRNNCVYGNGSNRYSQLGLNKDWKNKYEPVLIEDLFNVVDIKTAEIFCVALCDHGYIVINYWFKLNAEKDIKIPIDIMVVFKRFYGMESQIYTTKHDFGETKGKWNKLGFFNEKEIVQIELGLKHGVFRTIDGDVWAVEDYGMYCDDLKPKQLQIKSFSYNCDDWKEIKMKEIKCGGNHTLAIDTDNKLYLYHNGKLKVFESLKNKKIRSFKCGFNHSLVCTMDNEYLMWGSNKYNECIVDCKKEEYNETVAQPVIINYVLEKECNGKQIHEIYLGCGNTKLLVIDSPM